MTLRIVKQRQRGASGPCPLCGRTMPLTYHHLIPKKLHRRTYFKKHYTRESLASGIMICRQCHDGIHRLYSEMHLGRYLNTPELLQEDPALQRHFAWVSRQRRR
ncbi:MAG: HNH endonuclease [Pseudomonadota bacterium]